MIALLLWNRISELYRNLFRKYCFWNISWTYPRNIVSELNLNLSRKYCFWIISELFQEILCLKYIWIYPGNIVSELYLNFSRKYCYWTISELIQEILLPETTSKLTLFSSVTHYQCLRVSSSIQREIFWK